ncbi:DNA polymerase III subunit delta' [Anopheles sinensis]|uniref:DNA polymerase III subunit delta n=1 Tax=Anopheles sinensis TaxID=74873 RepID=A0A084WBY9_ANOSI|nr:DNA polymerase III subunit delta' [Anopheles sinensis]
MFARHLQSKDPGLSISPEYIGKTSVTSEPKAKKHKSVTPRSECELMHMRSPPVEVEEFAIKPRRRWKWSFAEGNTRGNDGANKHQPRAAFGQTATNWRVVFVSRADCEEAFGEDGPFPFPSRFSLGMAAIPPTAADPNFNKY